MTAKRLDGALNALAHLLEADAPPPLGGAQRGMVLNAPAGLDGGLFADGDWMLVQGFRPAFRTLAQRFPNVVPEPAEAAFDAAIVFAGRHRGQNEAWAAEAIRRCRRDAPVIVVGAKTDGIGSLRKRFSAALAIEGAVSKDHAMALWFRNGDEAAALANALETEASRDAAIAAPYATRPGMFSHRRVDPGSLMLARHLPANLTGDAADFCAGWGYLSFELAARAPQIRSVDLYEADHASLDAARRNMAALAPGIAADFIWCDLAVEPVDRRYDLIVMNPPFHQGRAADPGLGLALIRAASKALKPGGQLFMVANRQLPYETGLQAGFAKVEKLAEDAGFKVFRARR